MAKVNLISPWNEHYNKIAAFFKDDPYTTVLYDEEEKHIKLLVNEPFKAEALSRLLKTEFDFGGVKLLISVIPANDITKDTTTYFDRASANKDYCVEYQHALIDNDIFAYIREIKGMLGFDAVYVVFKKKVIQYYDDNIGDLNGMKSTLAEDIARDIFTTCNGVFFNTDTREVNEAYAGNISASPYPCRC